MLGDRPILFILVGVLSMLAGLVGLLVCLTLPSPPQLAAGLSGQLDRAFASLKSRIGEERRQLELEIELQQSEVRKSVLEARLEELNGLRVPDAQEAFERLTRPSVGNTCLALRLGGVAASFLLFISGFALLVTMKRWARTMSIVAGVAGMALSLAMTLTNLFVVAPALGHGVAVILTDLTVPGIELPAADVGGAVATGLCVVASVLLGIACFQYPFFLAIVCSTAEARDAFEEPF